jgi:uncharacterized protein
VRYVDTSFLIALFRHREQHHTAAAKVWRENSSPLLTTMGVCGELWTFMRRREHHAAAVRAVDAVLRSSSITVIEADPSITEAAWKWLRRRDEHPYSFVDATSFEVMRRRRIREALAFDGEFTRAGFREVR